MEALLVAILAVAALFGLVFNGYVLLVLVWQRRFQTASHLLILHLAIVDIVFCFLILLGNTPLALMPSSAHLVPPFLGQLQGFLWQVLPAMLVWTICGLTIDRYVAICVPFSYFKLITTRRASAWLLVSWLLVAILSSVPFAADLCAYQLSQARSSFAIHCTPINFQFTLIYSSLTVFLPVTITLILNAHILLIARNQRNQIVTILAEVNHKQHQQRAALNNNNDTKSPEAGNGPQEGRGSPTRTGTPTGPHCGAEKPLHHSNHSIGKSTASHRNGGSLLVIMVTAYMLLLSPAYLVPVVEAMDVTLNSSLVSLTTVLVSLIPIVNAYVYGVKSRLIRQTFKRLFQRYLYKQQASIEIDRRLSLRSQSSLKAAIGWHTFLTTSQYSLQNTGNATNVVMVGQRPSVGRKGRDKLRRNSAPSSFIISPSTGGPQSSSSGPLTPPAIGLVPSSPTSGPTAASVPLMRKFSLAQYPCSPHPDLMLGGTVKGALQFTAIGMPEPNSAPCRPRTPEVKVQDYLQCKQPVAFVFPADSGHGLRNQQKNIIMSTLSPIAEVCSSHTYELCLAA
ncbi:Beta-3 adrenergic receptor [Halotydeus destructor]|nr:Beta-3 adrenergic receptor [Halotydeus destructor]